MCSFFTALCRRPGKSLFRLSSCQLGGIEALKKLGEATTLKFDEATTLGEGDKLNETKEAQPMMATRQGRLPPGLLSSHEKFSLSLPAERSRQSTTGTVRADPPVPSEWAYWPHCQRLIVLLFSLTDLEQLVAATGIVIDRRVLDTVTFLYHWSQLSFCG